MSVKADENLGTNPAPSIRSNRTKVVCVFPCHTFAMECVCFLNIQIQSLVDSSDSNKTAPLSSHMLSLLFLSHHINAPHSLVQHLCVGEVTWVAKGMRESSV